MSGHAARVLCIGDWSDPEMANVHSWLTNHASLQEAANLGEAEETLLEVPGAVDWAVWAAPTRPFPNGEAIQRILRISPLTRLVVVTGTWLLAAGRTARVPPGVAVCRWDRWEPWAARHIASPSADSKLADSQSPSTAEQIDRLLEPGRFDPPTLPSLGVIVLAEGRREFDTIANAVAPLGAVAIWAHLADSFVGAGASLLIVDVEPDRLEVAWTWREKFLPNVGCLVCAGWEPNREWEVPWIRKPFRLDEFWQAVRQAL